jgi:transcriptional regulator with XRE-family HTH domain
LVDLTQFKLAKKNPNCCRTLIFDERGINEFASKLKELRAREGLSQNQLAFEAGLSLSQIARIETSRINPTICTVFALSRALNVPVYELFKFELAPKEK